MTAVQWVYANGSEWVNVDCTGQQQLEKLWSNCNSSWINCRTFPGGAYVDFSTMELRFNGFAYAIARCRS